MRLALTQKSVFDGFLGMLVSLAWIVAPVSATDIQAIIDERVSAELAPGIVVGLLHGDGSMEFYASGTLQVNGVDKVNEDTIFEIGSITKVFTAIIAAGMEQDGSLSLDDPVQGYMPIGVDMPTKNGHDISLRHLATHTSGLPRMPSENWSPSDPANPYVDYTPERMYCFLSGHALERDPGSKKLYSNLGMGLLGHVLELRSEQTYEELLQNRICEPLGMASTTCTPRAEDHDRVAGAHKGGRPSSAWDFTGFTGAGAINSTAQDMLVFAAANFRVVDSPIEIAMRDCRGLNVSDKALAWGSGKDARGRYVSHSGMTGGFASYLELRPDSKQAVIVLANSNYGGVSRVGAHLLNGERALDPMAPEPHILDELVGVYVFAHGAEFTFKRNGRRFRGNISGQQPATLHITGQDRFEVKEVSAQLTFGRNRRGEVDRVVLHQAGRHQEVLKRGHSPQAVDLGEYTGDYRFPSSRAISVKREGKGLSIKLAGQEWYPYVPVGRDRFEFKAAKAQFSFLRDSDGRIDRLILHQNGGHQEASKQP
jgi:D-alanyl-D-alanine-carboxypeptidase/D-alanyl-D-alanine-endopeptidase